MKHLKKFENYINENDLPDLVRCNWCEWSGYGEELTKDKYGDEVCPNCDNFDYIMDIKLPEDLIDYIKHNKPQENIKRVDYKDIEDYYKALYSEYYSANKYNL